jgi:N-acetylglucosaminyl-diphospho-decaprenol L-rhamnosyltransferase
MHPQKRTPRLDVIIVDWNHGARLERCLASLDSSSTHGFVFDRIVVVDNASECPFQPRAYPRLPPVTIIRNAMNRGFAHACNQGAAGSTADHLLFLNPDTCVREDAIARAVAALEGPRHERTAIVGLPLVDSGGAAQPTCGRFLTVSSIFNQVTGLAFLAPSCYRGFRMTDWDHAGTRRVDYVSGACLLVRRSAFDLLYGFDTRFVVYLEDADLALRARARGWETVYLTGTSVYHESGWRAGEARAQRLGHSWRSLLVYGRKHFGLGGAAAVAAIVLGLAPLARIGEAVRHRSWRQVLDVFAGYAHLWRGLLAELGPTSRAKRRRLRAVSGAESLSICSGGGKDSREPRLPLI